MNYRSNRDKELEDLKVLWEEYKYRHDLCWRIIFQITTAFVVLSVIPYVQTNVVRGLRNWVIAMPMLGILLVLFSLLVTLNELRIFYKVKTKYREIQSEKYGINHGRNWYIFTWFVVFYFLGMLAVGVINVYSIRQMWIPYIERTAEKNE